jgi:hypothetical protein
LLSFYSHFYWWFCTQRALVSMAEKISFMHHVLVPF